MSEAGPAPQPGDPAFLFPRLAIATPSVGAAAGAPASQLGPVTGGSEGAGSAAAAPAGPAAATTAAAEETAVAAAVGGLHVRDDDIWVGDEEPVTSSDEGGEDLQQ